MFHMPLFVFISGYFSHKKDTNSFKKDVFKLLYPLVIIQILFIIEDIVLTKQFDVRRVFTPWWVMWYLMSLIYWRTILHILPIKLLRHTNEIIIATFCIGVISGFLPLNRFLSMQRTFAFLPFFFLGYCMQGKNIYLPSKYKPICLIFLCSSFIVPLFFPQFLGDLFFADRYIDNTSMFCRIFVYCMSIGMSISFICVCPTTYFFAKQGKYTMQYYIYHALILYVLFFVVNKLNFPKTIFVAIIYIGVVISSIYFFSYSRFFLTIISAPSSIKKILKKNVNFI